MPHECPVVAHRGSVVGRHRDRAAAITPTAVLATPPPAPTRCSWSLAVVTPDARAYVSYLTARALPPRLRRGEPCRGAVGLRASPSARSCRFSSPPSASSSPPQPMASLAPLPRRRAPTPHTTRSARRPPHRRRRPASTAATRCRGAPPPWRPVAPLPSATLVGPHPVTHTRRRRRRLPPTGDARVAAVVAARRRAAPPLPPTGGGTRWSPARASQPLSTAAPAAGA